MAVSSLPVRKRVGSQVEVISIMRLDQQSFCRGLLEAVQSFQRKGKMGIGVGNLSVLGCLQSLGTPRYVESYFILVIRKDVGQDPFCMQ